MKNKSIGSKKQLQLKITTLFILMGLVLSYPALACKSAGPNKHVGVIVSINLKEHTLILKDAETGEEMTFKAAEQLIKPVRPNQEAVVTFEKTEKGMVATKIKV
jgi:hypothetical protein